MQVAPPSLREFLNRREDAHFIIGHASVLARIGGQLFMVDPVWKYKPYGNFVFYPEQIDCDAVLGLLDGVILTHGHLDHWAPQILEKLHCPVHIMGGRPNIKERIAKHAKRIVEHTPHTWGRLNGNVRVYFAAHDANIIDSLPFVASSSRAYAFGSDCQLGRQALYKIRRDIPRLDIAHVSSSFVHWFPFLQRDISENRRKMETARLVAQSERLAEDFCAIFQPTLAISTGSDLYYCEGRDHILNKHLFLPPPKPLHKLKAGDYVVLEHAPVVYAGSSAELFPAVKMPPVRIGTRAMRPCAGDIERMQAHLATAPFKRGWEIQINQMVIDTGIKEISQRVGGGTKNYYRFDFDKDVYFDWLIGHISMEEALGSRRFWFRRSPDRYVPELFQILNNYL